MSDFQNYINMLVNSCTDFWVTTVYTGENNELSIMVATYDEDTSNTIVHFFEQDIHGNQRMKKVCVYEEYSSLSDFAVNQ